MKFPLMSSNLTPQTYRYASIYTPETPPSTSTLPFDNASFPLPAQPETKPIKKPSEHQLIAIGLDCIFSVMLELNQRDPELCVQALQSLLQLLQNLQPEALINESKVSVEKMHNLLKQLRVEGK